MITKSVVSFAGRGILIGAVLPSLLYAGQTKLHQSAIEHQTQPPVVRKIPQTTQTHRESIQQNRKQQTLFAKQEGLRSATIASVQPSHSFLHAKSQTTAKVIHVAEALARAKKGTQAKTGLSSTAPKLIPVREELLRQSSPKQRVKRAVLLASTQQTAPQSQAHHAPTAEVLPLGTFTMRAYTHPRPQEEALSKTASGTSPEPGRTVAVDPRIIPLGTRIYIPGLGERIAEDVGRRIKGKRLDIFLPTVQHCRHFGVQTREVMALIE